MSLYSEITANTVCLSSLFSATAARPCQRRGIHPFGTHHLSSNLRDREPVARLLPLCCHTFPQAGASSPMTANDFRRLALSFPETSERAHMGHPDFRVGGKIFATLGYPDDDWAMVKLTPLEQEMFVKSHPAVFDPC